MTTPLTDREGGVATRIREARRGAGLSQAALASLVGVSDSTVWSWEAGRTKPGRERLAAIAFHCRRASAGGASRKRSLPVTMPREERMRAVVGAIARHGAAHAYPPTLREVQDETGFSSLSVVKYWLDSCERAGLLVRARGMARAVTLTEAGRAFAEAPPETRVEPPGRREDGTPDGTGSTQAADAPTDTEPQAYGSDQKTLERRRAKATTPAGTDPARGVGARIRQARRSADLTQRELATLVGVSSNTVWFWEAGRMTPTYEHRVAVASRCRMHVSELDGRAGSNRDLLDATAAAFRRAVAHLPERDIESIWTFIHFLRWRRHRRRRAA